MTNWTDKRCIETVYITPKNIIESVREYCDGQIMTDPATEPNNPTGAKIFYTEEDDGLKQNWKGPVFCNPPYGKVMQDWCRKFKEFAETGEELLALLPCGARFGTRYWQNNIFIPELTAICFHRGRVSFVRPSGEKAKGNPYDSCIYGFNVDIEKFTEAFQKHGKIVVISEII